MISKERLAVMMMINHPDEYYQQALKSKGIDYTKLTHTQISVFVATIKAIEADILIEMSKKLPVSSFDQEDIDKVTKP